MSVLDFVCFILDPYFCDTLSYKHLPENHSGIKISKSSRPPPPQTEIPLL